MASLPRSRRSTPALRSLGAAPRELSFVGSAVGAAPEAGGPRCVHCHRTPLVGEVVHVYHASSGGDRTVCALCRSLHREPPARSEIVHGSEHHRAVKPRTRAA